MGNDLKPTISIESLLRRPVPMDARHLNLRLSGRDVEPYRFLEAHHPDITASLLIRDCVRISGLLFALRNAGNPVTIPHEGDEKDLLEYMGAFAPQTPMDTRKRNRRD